MDERPLPPADAAPVFRLPRRLSGRRLVAALTDAGYAAEGSTTVRCEDGYVDSQDGALQRAGMRLRLRHRPEVWQILEHGWLTVQQPAAEEGAPPEGEAAIFVREIAGERRLLAHATVRTTGRRVRLRTPVGAELELLVARWSFVAPEGGATVPGPRVAALETPSPLSAEAEHLGAVLRDLIGLRRLADDPLAAALRALARPLPGAPVPAELRLAGTDTMATAAHKILGRQRYKMWANAAGTVAGEDPEFLHDLRVATRRARSALRLLVPVFGEERCTELRAELGWIAERLGAVRDLDVHLERVSSDLVRAGGGPGADAGFAAALRERRGPALAELRRALRTRRFETLLRALGGMAPAADAAPEQAAYAATPALEVAPALIAKAARRVRRWSEQAGAEAEEVELHRLRILFKRLRYTCEFFAELFGGALDDGISRLVPFQDCLGALQDAVVARGVLAEHVRSLAAAGPPSADDLLILGALLQVQREEIARRRGELKELLGGLPKLLKGIAAASRPADAGVKAAAEPPADLSAATDAPAAAARRRPGGRRTRPPR